MNKLELTTMEVSIIETALLAHRAKYENDFMRDIERNAYNNLLEKIENARN